MIYAVWYGDIIVGQFMEERDALDFMCYDTHCVMDFNSYYQEVDPRLEVFGSELSTVEKYSLIKFRTGKEI